MLRTIGLWLMLAVPASAWAAEVQRVNDPLDGATSGVQEGGSFVAGGWQAAAGDSRITYDLGGVYTRGRFEVDLTNFLPCVQPNNEKCHPLSMWQSTNQSRDSSGNAGESHWIFRTGNNYFDPCEYKLLTKAVGALPPASPACVDNEARIDTGYSWDASAVYHYTVEWSDHHIELRKRVGVDEVTLYSYDHCSNMQLRYLLIGRDRETKPNYGEQPGVIYSNVQVWVDDVAAPLPDAGVIIRDATAADAGNGALSTWLDPVDDTFAAPLEADQPHGALDNVQVGGDGYGNVGRTGYFKFDLRSIVGSVVSARLHVTATNGGGGGSIAHVSSNSWTEETLTWNNRPSVDGTALSTLSAVVIGDRYAWDVGSGLAGGDFRSLAVTSTIEDGAAYASKEHVETSSRPKLELVYLPGALPDAAVAVDSAVGVDSWTPVSDAATADHAVATDAAGRDAQQLDAAGRDIAIGADAAGHDAAPAASNVAQTGCGCASQGPTAAASIALLLLAAIARRRAGRGDHA